MGDFSFISNLTGLDVKRTTGQLVSFIGGKIKGQQSQQGGAERSHGGEIMTFLIYGIRLNLFFKPLSFAEHWSSDTGGRGFAAQLH